MNKKYCLLVHTGGPPTYTNTVSTTKVSWKNLQPANLPTVLFDLQLEVQRTEDPGVTQILGLEKDKLRKTCVIGSAEGPLLM